MVASISSRTTLIFPFGRQPARRNPTRVKLSSPDFEFSPSTEGIGQRLGWSSTMKSGRLLFVAALAFAIVGCGKTDRMMVSGTVMVDKKPVDRGLITIESVDNSDKPTGAS